jgi:hypothetical protein
LCRQKEVSSRKVNEMDKQRGKRRKEMDKEERKEMVKTDRERYAISYKPDIFNL